MDTEATETLAVDALQASANTDNAVNYYNQGRRYLEQARLAWIQADDSHKAWNRPTFEQVTQEVIARQFGFIVR